MPRKLAILVLLLLASCSGSGSGGNPDTHNSAVDYAGVEPDGLDGLPMFPPPEGVAREASAGGSIKRTGDQYEDKSNNAEYQIGDGYMLLESEIGTTSWASYSFNVGLSADVTMVLVRRLQSTAGTLYLLLANYETKRWEVHPLPTSIDDADPFLLTDNSNKRYTSPAGNVNVALLVHDGFAIGILDTEVYTTTPPSPPAWIDASDGTQYDRIIITWPSDERAILYEIEYKWREDPPDSWEILDSVFPQPGEVQAYLHTDVNPPSHEAFFESVYQYRVRCVYDGGGKSPTWSPLDEGYRTVVPPEFSFIGYRRPGGGIRMGWEYPSGIEACNIYRDGELLESNFTSEEYFDDSEVARDGESHEYSLRGVALEGTSFRESTATGRAILWEESSVIASPDFGKRDMTLDITAGNLPLATWINDVGQVGFAWATVEEPQGPEDWNVSTIYGAVDGEFDEHYSNSVVIFNGTPLVFFCEELDEYNVYCAVPNTMPAAGPDDWDVHLVWETPFYLTSCYAAVIGGVPHLLANGIQTSVDDVQAELFSCGTGLPDEASDWSMATATENPSSRGYSLFSYMDRPAFFSFDESQMVFHHATVDNPQEPSDFSFHRVSETRGFLPWMKGAVINGRPAFACKTGGVSYGYALVDNPQSAADWKIVGHGYSLFYGSRNTLLEYGGLPLVSCYSEDNTEMFLVCPGSLPAQSGPLGWHAGFLPLQDTDHGFANAMALQGGLPVVITSIEEAVPGELRYFRSY